MMKKLPVRLLATIAAVTTIARNLIWLAKHVFSS